MSLKVKYDVVLGRLREKDGDGGDTPTPSPTFTVTTTGSNKTYYADEKQTDTLTVVAECRYDGNLVDADSVPSGWERASLGTYSKTISGSGTIAKTTFTYTPQGGSALTAKSDAKTLTKVWPAYWGIYPSDDTSDPNITDMVSEFEKLGNRVTSKMVNNVVNIPNQTENDCWLWIVTRGSAAATPEAFDITILRDPVTGMEFTSPMDPTIELDGYKAYLSINKADAGQGFGNVKLSINLS